MMRRRLIPLWFRRGLEAGVIGAALAVSTLVAYQLSRPAPRLILPNGLDGSLILAPAVIALGVFVVSYPTFLAATREDAIFGVIAAFLIAADVFMLLSCVTGEGVLVHPLRRSFSLGIVAVAAALPAAAAGLLVGQITAPLGFGRSAGIRSAVGGMVVGAVAVLVAAYVV